MKLKSKINFLLTETVKELFSSGMISTGRNKKSGGHDHRTNSGDDRTPAQKSGDLKRRRD